MHVASFQNIVKILNMKLNQWLVQHIITCGCTPGFARKLQKLLNTSDHLAQNA